MRVSVSPSVEVHRYIHGQTETDKPGRDLYRMGSLSVCPAEVGGGLGGTQNLRRGWKEVGGHSRHEPTWLHRPCVLRVLC